MATANLGLTLPTPDVSTGWGGTLNTDFQLIDDVFAAAGSGTSVGINVGTGKTANIGGTLVAGGTVILGAGDATSTVTAPTIRGAARTGTNAVGANLTIDAANGTGTGGSGSIIFRTAPAGSSGSTANTMRTVMEIKSTGVVEVMGGNVSPTGSVIAYAGTTEPTGWLFCFGQSLSTTTYAALFAAIGYTYGGGGASFSLPDLRGRVAAGKDNMGGTSANRLTAGLSGVTGTTLGASGGAEVVALTWSQMPAHQHYVFADVEVTNQTSVVTNANYPARRLNDGGSSSNYIAAGTGALSSTLGLTSSAGSGFNHQNVQPTIVLQYIIKT